MFTRQSSGEGTGGVWGTAELVIALIRDQGWQIFTRKSTAQLFLNQKQAAFQCKAVQTRHFSLRTEKDKHGKVQISPCKQLSRKTPVPRLVQALSPPPCLSERPRFLTDKHSEKQCVFRAFPLQSTNFPRKSGCCFSFRSIPEWIMASGSG